MEIKKYPTMRTFDEYELLVVECRKFLFDIHIKLQIFESENSEYRPMPDGSNFYIWKSSEEDKIKGGESRYHRLNYLECWSKGDFVGCDYHANRF